MVRQRFRGYTERVADELRRSFGDEYSPKQIAGSFSLGVFITMLPTLGVGLLLFVVLAYAFDWINKIALFASVLVLNPLVKWGVYAGSMALGVMLLGPVDGAMHGDLSPGVGQAILMRLVVGNLVLALIATALAYGLVHRVASRHQDTIQDVVEVVIEDVIEEHEGEQVA